MVLSSCTTPTKIGTACDADENCNVAGQTCVAGLGGAKICTHTCTGNTGEMGCPAGFDCSMSSAGLTCNKVPYAVDPMTGVPLLYGKNCAIDATACDGTGDPNPMPACRKGPDNTKKPVAALMNDPRAYCSGPCTADSDCPSSMECAVDWDMVKKCIKRDLCTPCTINDDCPPGYPACISKNGTKYCSKACTGAGDCPGTTQGSTWMECTGASDSQGTAAMYCTHHYGKCVGDGQPCAPCRAKSDCNAGLTCFESDATLEKFCTKRCAMDSDCATTNSSAPSVCDNIMPKKASDPNPSLLCTGDVDHGFVGNASCWF